ncbi:MAG: YlmH/Sll1252 family protein [Peptoniphilus sp.]|uniref:YlmH family RNA-binding protein n=1 Tax=Peptoniphilus sp. TaxID=1971214 RepID=UPI002A749409|nr:YlmH/Sll1252 family protein [Peptoniphilus sp.]MDY2986972.1 YlmH/Sll1252 family protein [Peptoniphilus sp.]
MVKINKDKLFLHIPDDKLIVVKKVVDKIEIVLNKHEILSTDFLSPYEVELSKSILNRYDVSYLIDGGYTQAERNIIYIFPKYLYEIDKDKILYISLNKVENIQHKDVLGSILGLGIDRSKVGDIIIGSNNIFIFVKAEQYNFLRFNLKKIGKHTIFFSDDKFEYQETTYVENKFIVSSLRLDTILSSVLKISRSKVEMLIKSGRVQVNFKPEIKTSIQLKEGDILSVRGRGRIVFEKIENTTKKNNFVILIKFPK